jgi:hypothetical protein
MKFPILSLVALVAMSFIAADVADAQHFDIFLARPAVGNQTVIGGADVDNLAYDDIARVFEVELGELGAEFFALEPGVNHPNTTFPTNAYPASASSLVPGDTLRLLKTSFSVDGNVADLFYWNGVGPVSFSPAAANFRIELGDPLTDTPGVGGSFDDHPFFFVDDISLPGVYLASAYGVVDGFAPSVPVYLVMGTESLITPAFLGITQEEFDLLDEEALDAALELVIEQAAEWVESNLVVPEPGTLALASFASYSLLLIGRRQHLHASPECRA